ncbi:hypothetical protein BGZ98_009431 [Dissophora globulifera]|nr:hypothetical protein BGZ98_009431 [Dissophora globulifera]
MPLFEIPTDQEKWMAETELRRGNFSCAFFKFRYDEIFTPVESNNTAAISPKEIEKIEIKLAPELETFAGFARLQNKNPGITDHEHIFVACDGLSIAVYDICEHNGVISCIYSVSLAEISVKRTNRDVGTPVPRRDSCKMLMNSMHDSLCLWSNGSGTSSIWSWRNGSLQSYLKTSLVDPEVNDELLGRHACFSRDGSIVVFTELRFLVAFFTDSGLMLSLKELDGKVEELYCLDDGRLFTVIDSSLQILDITDLATCIDDSPMTWDGSEDTSSQTPEEPKLFLPMSSPGSEEWGCVFTWERNLITQEILLRICTYDGVESNSEGEENEVFCQAFFDGDEAELVILRHNQRFSVRLDSGIYLWQLPSSPSGLVILLTFEPCDFRLPWDGSIESWTLLLERLIARINELTEAKDNSQYSLAKDPDSLKMLETLNLEKDKVEALKDKIDELTALTGEPYRLKSMDDDYRYPVLCNHGNILRWHWDWISGRPDKELDISRSCYFGNQETLNCIRFIPGMRDMFVEGDSFLTAIQDYLMRHINRYLDYSDSVNNSVVGALVTYCDYHSCNFFIGEILKDPERSWVPHASLFSKDPDKDIFGILSKQSQRATIREFAEYMLESARRGNKIESHRNSGYLDLLLTSLPHIAKADPSMALWITRQAAFLPLDYDQKLLMHDAVLNNPPWQQSLLWKVSTSRGGFQEFKSELHEYDNPVFQVQSELPLTIGRSSLSSEPRRFPKMRLKNNLNDQIKLNFYMVPLSLAFGMQAIDHASLSPLSSSAEVSFFSWIGRRSKMLLHLFEFGHAQRVINHALPLEAYDNLAFEAIIYYKWSRFVRNFWILRFPVQVVYYILVLTVSFSQISLFHGDYSDDGQFIYNNSETALRSEFIAILAMGLVFFCLELRQARRNWRRYLTVYNFLDIFVYLLPMIVSAIQLAVPREANSSRLLSFAIILIYIHFIFELRVYKNICEVVTIIISIMVHVPSFFFILAVFVLAFAHSLLHLTQTNYQSFCPTPSNGNYSKACTEAKPAFPSHYFDAVTTTYFFIVGKYDAVADSMGQGQAAMQIMVALFVFLTAILMLNVVIALMNAAYSVGASDGLLVWVRDRIEVIARIESFSYLIPNYRFDRDYFPRYIFYTATEAQVRSFADKYNRPELLERFPKAEVESSAADREAAETAKKLASDVESLKQAMQEMEKARENDSKMIVEMLQDMQKAMVNSLGSKEE